MSDAGLRLRPLTEVDLPMLHAWLNRPHVVAWWGGEDGAPTLEEVRAHHGPRLQPDSTVRPWIALQGDEPIGFAQSYVAMGSGDGWWESETDPGVRGIDLFLAHPAQLGQGLGTRLVQQLALQLFADPAVTRLQVDPAPDNRRAIRCYERAGFVNQGQIRTPDGPAVYLVLDRAEFEAGLVRQRRDALATAPGARYTLGRLSA